MSAARRGLDWSAVSARILFDGDVEVLCDTVRMPSCCGSPLSVWPNLKSVVWFLAYLPCDERSRKAFGISVFMCPPVSQPNFCPKSSRIFTSVVCTVCKSGVSARRLYNFPRSGIITWQKALHCPLLLLKVEVKFVVEQSMKAQRRSRDIALLLL